MSKKIGSEASKPPTSARPGTFYWGNDPFWRECFSKGLVQPPTRFVCFVWQNILMNTGYLEYADFICWWLFGSCFCDSVLLTWTFYRRIADVGEERGADLKASLGTTWGIQRLIGSPMRHWWCDWINHNSPYKQCLYGSSSREEALFWDNDFLVLLRSCQSWETLRATTICRLLRVMPVMLLGRAMTMIVVLVWLILTFGLCLVKSLDWEWKVPHVARKCGRWFWTICQSEVVPS